MDEADPVYAVTSLIFSAVAAISHSADDVMGVAQLPDVLSAKPPSYCPAGQMRLQPVAPASLPMPASHAAQLAPLAAVYWPGSHVAHVVVVALVLPRGAPVPAAHGVPAHAALAPVPAAWVPLGQAVHAPLQRHGRELLQAMMLLASVLK
jgi:hypothetical protein